MLLACYWQVDMILTAEHLLHVLHLHQYFGADPLSVSITPNKTEESHTDVRFLGKAVKDLIYYLSGGERYDAECFQKALNYYLVRIYYTTRLATFVIFIT